MAPTPVDERPLVFVLRCAGSAAAAYLLATAVGLDHPVWAPMSALIVSQERFIDTWASLSGRVLGTCMGLVAAVTVDLLLPPLRVPMAAQIAVAVALCAIVARRRPLARVSMWTGPIVLLTPAAGAEVIHVALLRGTEVILGSLVGVALHWVSDWGMARLSARRKTGSGHSLAAPGAPQVPGHKGAQAQKWADEQGHQASCDGGHGAQLCQCDRADVGTYEQHPRINAAESHARESTQFRLQTAPIHR